MKKIPYISIILFAMCIIWFIYVTITYKTTESPTILYQNGAILGQFFTTDQWWRLISPIFAHIGYQHLASNMILLLSLGTLVEKILGHLKFATLYFISGIGGNLAVILFDSNTITAGASTSLYGLLGFLFIQTFNKNNSLLRNIGWSYLALIITNIIYTLTSTNVSLFGHTGGFIIGSIFGLIQMQLDQK